MSPKSIPLCKFILFCILLSLTTACDIQSKKMDLIFQTIEKKDETGTGTRYEVREPGLMVVSQPEEVDSLDGLITEDARQALLGLDYNRYFALAVFQGWKPTGGYSILVSRVSRFGDVVHTYVQFQEPKPDEEKTDEITSPYHLIIVHKDSSWGQEFLFNLIVNDTVVTSLSHEIP
jgi:hypothetical protein